MTTEQLQSYRDAAAAAKELADKATPGPWKDRPSPVDPKPYRCIYFGPSIDTLYNTSALLPQDAKFVASARRDIPTLADAVVELAAEVERLQADNAKLHNRIKEQTAATQEAHEFVDNEIRNHLEGIVELGDKSCPIWQRVRSAVERLTEACAKGAAIIRDIADGSEYARGREDERNYWRQLLRNRDWIAAVEIINRMNAIERGEHVAEEATNGKDV